ncbi:hypothetical protein ACWDBD_31740 [Streptomyces sp. NPDC001118]|uniref:hypothetical protein n=1 Tax=Streptomyces sp. NPDC002589 TaxID=3154420 RepID=UPI00332AC00D
MLLADRAERLREELAEIDAEVARLEAAEVKIGQFIVAERIGQTDDPAMAEELERAITTPGAGGTLLASAPATSPPPRATTRSPPSCEKPTSALWWTSAFVGLDDDLDNPVIATSRRGTRGHPPTEAQKEANRLPDINGCRPTGLARPVTASRARPVTTSSRS